MATPSPVQLPVIGVKGPVPCLEKGCSVCCHDTEMLLTDADVARLSAQWPDLPFWREADDGYLELQIRPGNPVAGHIGQPCIFLDAKGLCTTFESRPEGCRLYPGLWDDVLGLARLDDEHCPHTDGFRMTLGTGQAIRDLAARLHAERDHRMGDRA